MARLVLHLFGSPKMEVHGAPVDVDTRKATALMAFLAVTGETHQRDTLATLLWPDYDQTNARAALRRTLSTLNKALGSENEDRLLEIARESVGLAPGADLWLDVSEFHRLVEATQAHGHTVNEICPLCLEPLSAAVKLYREPFMAGFSLRDSPNFEEWQFFQEETLRRELSGALERLVNGLGEAGKHEEAIQHARRWLALDPLLEDAHRQLMRLYVRADQRNAALRQYRECVRILDQELGVAPLDETMRLYEAILNREPFPEMDNRLHFVTRTLPEAGQAGARAAGNRPAASEAAANSFAATAESTAEPAARETAQLSPLVGREAEWQILRETYDTIREDGGLIAVVGEAGIGKTRLAEELLAYARGKGARVVQARCYAGETSLAYAPFLQGFSAVMGALAGQPRTAERIRALPVGTLAEAGRLLPELAQFLPTAPLSASGGEGAQARFYESLRQTITALLADRQPGILFLDDLHWADAASLDLLTYLTRRLRGTGMLILATWRDEPGEVPQALDRLTGELKRVGQAVRVQLRRLNAGEVVELVRSYPGAAWQSPEALGRRLHQESEGLPFVAVEYLATLAQHAAQKGPEQGPTDPAAAWEIPASVRDLLHSRLAELDSTAQQILSTAAVIGRSFDFTTLRDVSGRSEFETVDGLEKLLYAGLVSERDGQAAPGGEIRYDFTHEKLRALIYDETSLARRRLLHRRIAETLTRPQSAGEQAGIIAGLAAYHYQQAGMAPQAGEYHLLAGEHARRVFANTEAMAHFQAALACEHPDQAGLHEAIGDLHTLRGDYSAAIHSYQRAAAFCSEDCTASLEHKLGNVHQRMGDWELAESHYLASLEALDAPAAPTTSSDSDTVFQVRLYADRSLAAYSRGDMPRAQGMAARAMELAQTCADPHALAQAHNMLGVLARARGEPDEAIRHLEASLEAAKRVGDPSVRIAALNNLALVYGENAHVDQAIELAKEALNLCIKQGDRHRQAALHNNLADLLHQSHREEEAMVQLKQAVVIFAEIGGQPQGLDAGSGGPAGIWKLTEW